MALGGGKFIAQNKVLPGSYVNFVSASKATATLSDRGVAAFPIAIGWGEENKVFSVTAEEFMTDSLKIFGYPYTAKEMKGIREIFLHAKECHFYNLNSGGANAANGICSAKHPGELGNKIKIVITSNENSTPENPVYDVATYFDGTKVDEQLNIKNADELKHNDFVKWSGSPIELTAGMPLSGGTTGTVTDGSYQTFLDAMESYTFNTIGTNSTDDTIKSLFANWTKRMRDDIGIKFQCVLYKYARPDYEGIISVENTLVDEITESGDLVYWVVGASAGCAVNKSLTNSIYDGEFDIDVAYTQTQLEDAIKGGKFVFHKVNDKVRVLDDINTFVSATDDKSADFSSNQTIRVLDQVGNDIAILFNEKYLGKVANNTAGRTSFWNDIVKHHQELERIGAIEAFMPDKVTVAQGDSKKAVVVSDYITPVNAMAQLYMTVIVE
jgi:hypothetical protein